MEVQLDLISDSSLPPGQEKNENRKLYFTGSSIGAFIVIGGCAI